MTVLSVNLNKVALLRNQRDLGIPSVIDAAKTAIRAGSHGITVHPRPDERHIRYSDVYELAEMLTVEYNIEGNPFTGRFMEVVGEVRPTQATLVPDTHDAKTSDHGWDLHADGGQLKDIVARLKDLGIRVSLFMDPDIEQIRAAARTGTDRIELYTEPYARAFTNKKSLDEVLGGYADAAKAAADEGLGVNAGHDLNLENLGLLCGRLGNVLEVSIGHALIKDALEMGLFNAVRAYLDVLGHAKQEKE